MGFTRRFSNFPPVSQITEIEGVVIVDQTAPGAINGVGSGVAALVGEFPDVTFAVSIDANGAVTTKPQPILIFSGQDFANKLGGLDETIGEFGVSGGNGWAELKNKAFSQLIVVPINIASSHGIRLWRKLPTNKSATNPAPVVPLVTGIVEAGREFKSGSNRVRTAQRVAFSETSDFTRGVDGAITNTGVPASHQPFASAGALFTSVIRPDGSKGVLVGDLLVLGVIGGAGALGANADTYRVRTVTSDTALDLEKLDGSNFDWTTGVAQPWRVHTNDCADTGTTHAFAAEAGCRVPARPLDATIGTAVTMSPTLVPAALTADNADPLSGLQAHTDPTTGLVYVAAVQAPNAAAAAAIDALYVTAIDALLSDDEPASTVNIVWAARYSSVIDNKIVSHCLNQKANGIGRIGVVSPPVGTIDPTVAIGDGSPGVGFARARECAYTWPGAQTFASEAVGKSIKGSDGLLHTDGILDTPGSGWLASAYSQLAPERNVGQGSDPIKTIMAPTLGLQRGVTGLDLNYYKIAKSRGIVSMRNDRALGRIFESDVTRSLLQGETIMRVRRFSFFIQDTLAAALAPLAKEPLSEDLKDHIITAHIDFFEQLLSKKNPAAQRILAYNLDPITGNTPELEEAGVYVVIHNVEMLATADDIVLQSAVGYGVVNVSQLAA